MSNNKPDCKKWRSWSLPLTTLIVNSDFNRPEGTQVVEIECVRSLVETLKQIKAAALRGYETPTELECFHLADDCLAELPAEWVKE